MTDSSAGKDIASQNSLGKVKHIRTQYLWVQERVANKDLKLSKVWGHDNPADLLTKPLPETRIRELADIFQQEIFARSVSSHEEQA